MGLHRFLFPNCTGHELERVRLCVTELEAVIKTRDAELKEEIARNRQREDELISRIIVSKGHYGIPARDTTATNPTPDVVIVANDQAKEEQIDAQVLQWEQIYRQRGRNVPRPEIRKMVEENFTYLMDDSRVEL